MKNLFTFFVVFFSAATIFAQFTLDGEIRPRTEFLHGYKAPTMQNTDFNLVTSQRTRLGFGYKSELFDVGVQIQDVRTWGQQNQLVNNSYGNMGPNEGNWTSLHQAWAKIRLNSLIAIKVGRQELVYDDHRILGNVGWAQQARSHDLALFQIEQKDAFKLHVGFAVNQVQTIQYDLTKNYKSMQFMWFNKQFGDAYTLSILFLNNGIQDTLIHGNIGGNTTTYSQIIGQRSVYKAGKLKVGLNFYYQMGNDNGVYVDDSGEAQRRKLAAMNLGIDLDYKLNDNFNIGVGFEMLTGNSQTDTTKAYAETNHAFTPLYGTNHKFNGWMDYFYVANHKNSVGLNDIYFKLGYKKDKFLAGAHFHYFMANADVKDVKEFASTGKIVAMSSNLGMELDTYIGYKIGKGVLFKGGISGMFDTETMRALKGGDYGASNYWGWMMIVVKPTFFKSEKKKIDG